MEDLIEKIIKGDAKAFNELFIYLYSDLFKIAKTRLLHNEDIEDAIQDTMIEVYKSVKKLRDISKAKAWIIKILVNKCNKIYRKKYNKNLSIEEYNLEEYLQNTDMDYVEADIEFYSLLEGLKYNEKIILVLYYAENYSIKEIQKIINMKENTIATNLYRARKKIEEKMKREVENER